MTVDDIRKFSPLVRERVNQLKEFRHPLNANIKNVSHIMWTDHPRSRGASARNAVFYGDRGIDRSPCGTGTSARMAQLVAKGEWELNQSFIHESIIGSLFTGSRRGR